MLVGAGLAGADTRIPQSGFYDGTAYQRGTGAGINRDYPVVMEFSTYGSTVAYPALGCWGHLLPVGFDGSRRVYRERIVGGRCDDGCTWLVSAGPNGLLVRWTLRGRQYEVDGFLHPRRTVWTGFTSWRSCDVRDWSGNAIDRAQVRGTPC